MKKSDIEKRVKAVVAHVLSIESVQDRITLKSRFVQDLGADSIDMIELSLSLEEEFGMEIPDEDAEKIISVGMAVEYISKALTVSDERV